MCCTLAREGYDVHVVAKETPDVPIGTHQVAGVTVHPVRAPRGRGDRTTHRNLVLDQVRKVQADIYHVHEPELLGPTIALAAGKPVIWDVHEVYMEAVKEREWIPQPLRPLAAWAWDRQERGMMKHCAAVVAATETVAVRYYPLHPRVLKVWNYPELSDFTIDPDVAREVGTVVYLGSLDEPRGTQQAIRAAVVLKKRGVTARLKIAPWHSEHRLQYLQNLTRELDADDVVEFLDRMGAKETALFLNRAWIGLVPHLPTKRMALNMPVKILEYMAMGLPVVYTDLPNHREVTLGRNVGMAVDTESPEAIADAIQHLIEHPDQARAMGLEGRALVESDLNWGCEGRALCELYRSLLSQ